MEAFPEVIITASSNVSVFDAVNKNLISCYTCKGRSIAPRTLSLVSEDFIIGALTNEPKIQVWTIYKGTKQESSQFPCRGFVKALTVTSCGTYCVAGIKEEIHIWRVSSGDLLNIVTRHYQDISCLRFSSDDSHLLSGGKDGYVIAWIFSQMIDVTIERDQVKPRHLWNHTQEVTDIFPGSLGCVSRVATTSLDMTCQLYELDSGTLLSTICLGVPLTSVVMDTLEYHIFLGANNGCIYKINTYESLPREFQITDLSEIQWKAHSQKITSLSISCDGVKLLSASEDKNCKLWDTKSMTCLHNLSMDGPFTNAFLAIKPAALPNDDVLPPFVFRHFKREFNDLGEKGIRTYTESKMKSQQCALNLGNSEHLYSELLHGAAKVNTDGLSKSEHKFYEDMYQESLHGGTVKELQEINNQMYSYLINHGLDRIPKDTSD